MFEGIGGALQLSVIDMTLVFVSVNFSVSIFNSRRISFSYGIVKKYRRN
jgi:hypothetical protein